MKKWIKWNKEELLNFLGICLIIGSVYAIVIYEPDYTTIEYDNTTYMVEQDRGEVYRDRELLEDLVWAYHKEHVPHPGETIHLKIHSKMGKLKIVKQ